MRRRLGRWISPLASGALVFLVLLAIAFVRFKVAEAGTVILIGGGMLTWPVKSFAIQFVLTLLLPFYLISAMILWTLTLAGAAPWIRGFSDDWRKREGFALTCSALLWVHLFLWWQVPSALWLLPGLSRLPFWLIFPLLLAAALAYPVRWLVRRRLGWLKGPAVLVVWLFLWSLPPYAPRVLPRFLSAARGGSDATKVLVIGLDGLRHDVGQEATRNWIGTSYDNAYTVIPATRLLWHILWGGDPLYYTVGHAPPALEEYTGVRRLPLVDEAARKGWRPRFYIDDGGTIGLIGRALTFDDMLMPAPGWENFVNSNLSASFPLFAAWENLGRAFPTTNPWAPLDGGLRETLRLGRGSKWVMFHSCLAHQPIFLQRGELAQLGRWWSLAPAGLEPYVARQQVTVTRAEHYDPRRDPFLAYRIRMHSILQAWEPIWNGLAQDPQYRDATRVLFSDHGERFYHVTEAIQLGGVHGYNLDPWETRIMLKVAGPGFAPGAGGPARSETISVLSLRDAIGKAIEADKAIVPDDLNSAYAAAPMRYQCLERDLFSADNTEYRQLDVKSLVKGTGIAKDGIWFTQYESSPEQRAEDLSIAWGRGPELEVIRPLKAGGAHRYLYQGFELRKVTNITEDEYKAEKDKINQALARPIPGLPKN